MTNNPYFTLTFFTRKPRSEGYTDHKVYVRISVAGQQTDLAIGRSVNPENWDQKRKLSKGRSRRDLELNKYLDEIRARFCEIHTNLVREKKLVNPIVMRDLFLGKVEKPKMLCEIFTESNAKRKEEMERGDMVNATYLRWERCVTYLGEFMHEYGKWIYDKTEQLITDHRLFPATVDTHVCPICGRHSVIRYPRVAKCHVCGFTMPLQFMGHKFTDKEVASLLTHGYTSQIMFTNRHGHEFYDIVVRGKGKGLSFAPIEAKLY